MLFLVYILCGLLFVGYCVKKDNDYFTLGTPFEFFLAIILATVIWPGLLIARIYNHYVE